MPKMLCDKSVRCLGTDSPIENYSSEAPDDLRFIGLQFPYGPGHWHDPSNNYRAEGCLGVCYSTVSQEDADLCAALQAYLCNQDDCDPADPNCAYQCPGDPRCSCTADDPDPNCKIHCPGDPRCNPDCPPDDPNCPYTCPGDPRCAVNPVYYNVEQTCHLTCPDGNTFVWVVPARKFASDSQLLSDRMAQSYCKQQANFHMVCLSNIPDTAIEGTAYKNPNGSTVRIQATGATVGKDTWTLVQGLIPPGLTLHLNQEVSGGIALDGVPTVFGVYSFTVKVTTPSGDFMAKTYTITVSGLYNDMGMDQAVYHPTRGTVFGVRGAYLFEFRAGSDTLLANRKRFRPIGFSDSSIAYDPITDRLFVSCWNDPGGEFFDNSNNVVDNPYRVVYEINPSTLAVESSFDPWSVFGIGFNIGPYFGPHQIVVSGGLVYGFYYTVPSFPRGNPFSWNPGSNVSVDGSILANFGSWIDFVVDETNGFLYFTSSGNLSRVFPVDKGTLAYDFGVNPDCRLPSSLNPVGIAQYPTTGTLYVTTRTNQLARVSTPITANATAPLGYITLPGTAPNPWRVRYNPFDGKIYVPCYGENTVVVVDPVTDTVVATKTGGGTPYDLPFDVVFTPTEVYVVQHGINGFRKLV